MSLIIAPMNKNRCCSQIHIFLLSAEQFELFAAVLQEYSEEEKEELHKDGKRGKRKRKHHGKRFFSCYGCFHHIILKCSYHGRLYRFMDYVILLLPLSINPNRITLCPPQHIYGTERKKRIKICLILCTLNHQLGMCACVSE